MRQYQPDQPCPGGIRSQQPCQVPRAWKKKAGEGGAFPQSEWQEGALGLLLLAAAELTALLSHLQTAVAPAGGNVFVFEAVAMGFALLVWLVAEALIACAVAFA